MVSTVNKTKTEDSIKNLWGTSKDLKRDALYLYGRQVKTDVCSMAHNAQAMNYILPPDYIDRMQNVAGWREREAFRQAEQDGYRCVALDALMPSIEWGNDWFCNPPFSTELKKRFIRKAQAEKLRGNGGVMILPYVPATDWWRQLLGKGVIVYEPDGRYSYVNQNGELQKGCNFDSCVVVFPTFFIGDSIRIPYQRYIGRELNRV